MQRVLVVDDDRLVADTLTLIFERNGFAAKAVYSADEALRCAREFGPDLLLCDVTMPGRDGLSLVADMRRQQKDQQTPVNRCGRIKLQAHRGDIPVRARCE